MLHASQTLMPTEWQQHIVVCCDLTLKPCRTFCVQTPNIPSTERSGEVPCYEAGGAEAPVMFLPWMRQGGSAPC